MSDTMREINKITGTIISVSWRLIVYALVILLLYTGVAKGYAFGYEIFHSTPMAAPPGVDKLVYITEDKPAAAAAQLKKAGLIPNEFIFEIQAAFYEYEIHPGEYTFNTSMTSKEILQLLNESADGEEEGS